MTTSDTPGPPVSAPPTDDEHVDARGVRSASVLADDHSARRPSDEGSGLYKLLVDSVRDYAIFALDATGHILTWNAGAERFKGYKAHEIIGKHFRQFYPPEDQAARKPERELEEAIANGRVEDEGWRIRKDGSRFWANVVITALRRPDGSLVGFAKVTRDLTERRRAEQALRESEQRAAVAEAANRTKAEFLASMSHELRTPLNAIGGYADLLLAGVTGELSAVQRDYLDRLRRSQQHLLSIINDLLNFTRIEAGRVTYDISAMSITDAVRRVLPMVEPQALHRGVAIKVRGTAECYALADQPKVEQILLNLLSNSIKFTDRGGSISVEQFDAGDRAGVRVVDTGIGIDENKLESIFEPFVQVGRTLTTAHEGTGLGLAISRDLARAMNGNLVARSAVGSGSTFELTLPKA